MVKVQVNESGKVLLHDGKALIAQEGGSSGDNLRFTIDEQGVVRSALREEWDNTFFSKISTVENNALSYMFKDVRTSGTPSGSIDLSNLNEVKDYGMYDCFEGREGITDIDMSSLKTIGREGMNGCFYHTGIESFNLNSLKIVEREGMGRCFAYCEYLTECNFPNLIEIKERGLRECFEDCSELIEAHFPKLTSIKEYEAMYECFGSCENLKHIYFNALTTNSFYDPDDDWYESIDEIEQFDDMLWFVDGCTIHFPSNLENVVSQLYGYPLFGGHNTILSFDLPATE